MAGETVALLERLQRHYIKPGESLPGGVFLPEVGWNGQGGYRRCDALYVGFTTTSGRILVGHELKVSRADWLNELNKPGKADAWADACHQWWLVVSDPMIVRDGELPAGWGLMSPGKSKTRMHVQVAAETKRDHHPPWVAVRSIIARQDTLRAQAITAGRQRAHDDLIKTNEQRIELEVGRRMNYAPDAEKLRDQLSQIEAALGGRIDWDAGHRGYIRTGDWVGLDELKLIAQAVRAAGNVAAAVDEITGRYFNPVNRTREALDRLSAALTELKEARA